MIIRRLFRAYAKGFLPSRWTYFALTLKLWVSTTFGASRAYQGETLLLNPLVKPHQFLPILLVKSLAPNVVEIPRVAQRAGSKQAELRG